MEYYSVIKKRMKFCIAAMWTELENMFSEKSQTEGNEYPWKAVLRGKFIVIEAFLKKEEKSEINNLPYHLKELGKKRTNKAPNQQNENNNKDEKGNN